MLAFRLILLFAVAVASAGRPSESAAQEIGWEKIPPFRATLFYPGVASWEFLLSDSHRLGGKNIKKGERACIECHLDEATGNLDVAAEQIAAGKLTMKRSSQRFEPDPIPGKKGFLKTNVQAAYDDEYLYLRFDWESDGASWNEPAADGLFDSVAVQVNKSQNTFKRYGCFVACHKFLASMPEAPSKKEMEGHPYYGPLKRDDLRLYAFYTREAEGWTAIKKEADLKRLLGEGGLIDLWRVRFSGKKTEAEDWSIFTDRLKDKQEDVEGSGAWENGHYTVLIKRKLQTGDADDVQLAPGDELTVGVAIHDDKVKQRKHYVSFPISIGLGSSTGMIKAVKIK